MVQCNNIFANNPDNCKEDGPVQQFFFLNDPDHLNRPASCKETPFYANEEGGWCLFANNPGHLDRPAKRTVPYHNIQANDPDQQ